jgi:hypothetical protein
MLIPSFSLNPLVSAIKKRIVNEIRTKTGRLDVVIVNESMIAVCLTLGFLRSKYAQAYSDFDQALINSRQNMDGHYEVSRKRRGGWGLTASLVGQTLTFANPALNR